MRSIILRQYDANGNCIDHARWRCEENHFNLHVLMYDVRLKGCVRFAVVEC
jgi:hypothetical protein